MFRSKSRPIVITQYEHGRLAGTLAQHWGNDQFERPPFDFDAFVQGVALHDWHYGFYDNLPIIGAPEPEWVAITKRGLEMRWDDPIMDIIIKLHLRRLCSYNLSEERVGMMTQFSDLIDERIPETGFSRADFEWADKITRLCDNAAFYFCFEGEWERKAAVCPKVGSDEAVEIEYCVEENGRLSITPWPFSVPIIMGNILGFQADRYPEQLNPIVVPFHIYEQKRS